MTEANMWKWLKKANGPDVFMWRVENSVASGSPDVEGFARGYGQFYIELKFSKEVGDESKVRTHARISQEIWHCRLSELGSTCHYILIQVGKEKFLLPGALTSVFNSMQLKAFRRYDVTALSPSEIIDRIKSGS